MVVDHSIVCYTELFIIYISGPYKTNYNDGWLEHCCNSLRIPPSKQL